MNEIYWLTRLDSINNLLIVILLVVFVSIIVFSLLFTVSDCYEEDLIKKRLKTCIIIGGIASLIFVFVPTTKEAYMIYGLGGTIEYIKSNDKVKELPDKCVEALDKLVEEYINKKDE